MGRLCGPQDRDITLFLCFVVLQTCFLISRYIFFVVYYRLSYLEILSGNKYFLKIWINEKWGV